MYHLQMIDRHVIHGQFLKYIWQVENFNWTTRSIWTAAFIVTVTFPWLEIGILISYRINAPSTVGVTDVQDELFNKRINVSKI